MATLTPKQFAQWFEPLRHSLTVDACEQCHQWETAEDLVSDVCHRALLILELFDEETGTSGLKRWLGGILKIVVLRWREREAERLTGVSLDSELPVSMEARLASLYARPSHTVLDREWLTYLPRHLRDCVRLNLDGHSVKEIAHELFLHRNTVSRHLSEANCFARKYLGDLPLHLFKELAHVEVYHAPVGVWPNWKYQHPYERPYRDPDANDYEAVQLAWEERMQEAA